VDDRRFCKEDEPYAGLKKLVKLRGRDSLSLDPLSLCGSNQAITMQMSISNEKYIFH
jgi:hypothetical protein